MRYKTLQAENEAEIKKIEDEIEELTSTPEGMKKLTDDIHKGMMAKHSMNQLDTIAEKARKKLEELK